MVLVSPAYTRLSLSVANDSLLVCDIVTRLEICTVGYA